MRRARRGIRSRHRAVRERRDARDLDPLAAPDDRTRLVLEQRRREPVELRRARERVARDGDVVVSEHDEGVEAAQRLVEAGAAAGVREQVAGDDDEIRVAAPAPSPRRCGRRRSARGRPEVEVGEVRDPQAVERCGQPCDGTSSTRVRSQPASNQP